MKKRSILFPLKDQAINAIMSGEQTSTRSILHKQPAYNFSSILLSYGGSNHMPRPRCFNVGEVIWVKEAWSVESGGVGDDKDYNFHVCYRADLDAVGIEGHDEECQKLYDTQVGHWRPSIFMPEWASRISLEVVNSKLGRLQDMTEDDALAEGIIEDDNYIIGCNCNGGSHREETGVRYYYPSSEEVYEDPIEAFVNLWDARHGSGSWDSNPVVLTTNFKVLNIKGEQ